MSYDIRKGSASFYDLQNFNNSDIPFYLKQIGTGVNNVLELGCGTGRVLSKIVSPAIFCHGIDISRAMIKICKETLLEIGHKKKNYDLTVADITNFNLNKKYDLIIAPFRVIQNIEKEQDVDNMLTCIRNHLTDTGSCILNVFKPKDDREELLQAWPNDKEYLDWEKVVDDKRITCSHVKRNINKTSMVLYPDLIYRTYSSNKLINKEVLSIPMKCYYPDEFIHLIIDNGFTILNTWGGYQNENYGDGSELVIQITK